jgi:Fic family protein
MHVAKEATLSSKIEGTQTSIDDVFTPKEEFDDLEKRDDWDEVQNYITAMNFSIERLKDIPLSIRLMKETHAKLLAGVRGFAKLPGEVRVSQNWIGGTNIMNAKFVPPHFQEVPELLSDLERYWHNQGLHIPDLIKVAVSHYQFETIHPFLDGNGRIGRLFITLHLISLGILNRQTLYISDFFEKHRSKYYDALSTVRGVSDIEHWILFFLTGIIETSKRSRDTLEAIVDLRKKYEDMIFSGMGIKRGKLGRQLLLKLFSKPVVTITDIAEMLSVTFPTASAIASEFQKLGLFTEKTGKKKDRIFYLREYLDLFSQ